MTPAVQAVAEALWRNVDDDFAADGPQQAFIAHCHAEGDLAFAAQRYRERLVQAEKSRPDEAEHIQRRLESITAMAMAELSRRKEEALPGQTLKRGITIVAVLFCLVAFAVLMFVLQL